MLSPDTPASSTKEPSGHEACKSKGLVEGDDGEWALEAKGLSEVCQPTAEERAKHSLTHLPYKKWCKWCRAARMLNTPHFSRPAFSRSAPLLVLDYCFLKHAQDERWLTVLVGRVYPSRCIFAVPCMKKGPDAFVTRRLAAFFRTCGLTNFSWMGDQEGALGTMMNEAVNLTKGRGEWVGAVPEHSAVGQSASNSRAERSVQRVEDHIRTLLGQARESPRPPAAGKPFCG